MLVIGEVNPADAIRKAVESDALSLATSGWKRTLVTEWIVCRPVEFEDESQCETE